MRRILDTAGVDRSLTRATLESPHEIKLADRDKTLSAKTILVATGGHPMIPDVPGKEHLISSNECFELEQLPASIAIIGAGYIGMEFASIFNGLGVAVPCFIAATRSCVTSTWSFATDWPRPCEIAASISG